jgi:hypothetical protein
MHWSLAEVLEMDMDEFLFWIGKLSEVLEAESEAVRNG